MSNLRKIHRWIAPGRTRAADVRDLVRDIENLTYNRKDECRDNDCLPGEQPIQVTITVEIGVR